MVGLKSKIVFTVILLTFSLSSCKKQTKQDDTVKKTDLKIENNVHAEEANIKVVDSELDIFNKKMVGLTQVDSLNFKIDFNTACMCQPNAFYIDKSSKKIYIVDYCQKAIDDKKYTFDISKVDNVKEGVLLYSGNIKFLINKYNDKIFKLSIQGNMPNDYDLPPLCNFFIKESDDKSFAIEDCGDFDG